MTDEAEEANNGDLSQVKQQEEEEKEVVAEEAEQGVAIELRFLGPVASASSEKTVSSSSGTAADSKHKLESTFDATPAAAVAAAATPIIIQAASDVDGTTSTASSVQEERKPDGEEKKPAEEDPNQHEMSPPYVDIDSFRAQTNHRDTDTAAAPVSPLAPSLPDTQPPPQPSILNLQQQQSSTGPQHAELVNLPSSSSSSGGSSRDSIVHSPVAARKRVAVIQIRRSDQPHSVSSVTEKTTVQTDELPPPLSCTQHKNDDVPVRRVYGRLLDETDNNNGGGDSSYYRHHTRVEEANGAGPVVLDSGLGGDENYSLAASSASAHDFLHNTTFNGSQQQQQQQQRVVTLPPPTAINSACRQQQQQQQQQQQSRQLGAPFAKSANTNEVISHHPVFVKDTSKYWYKPAISREQAISMLRDKPPGTFVVRDSNSFPGAFGLALKVATPPPGVPAGDGTELVRHFLIEPCKTGVKLKGCNNEPAFGTLSALVYQHSITALALPVRLVLPVEFDPAATPEHVNAAQQLLEQGAACNVSYVGSADVESLTGAEAVRRAVGDALAISRLHQPSVSVHFKVSSSGITLTDNTRRAFFRRHFPVHAVIFAGLDPSERRFDNAQVLGLPSQYVASARLFAFIARKNGDSANACHVFAELEPEQPASAVVNFINKVMLAQRRHIPYS